MAEAHESFTRLLAAAKSADPALAGQKELRNRLGISAQTVTNWKSRGVAKEAAMQVQRDMGISAAWILHGLQPALLSQSQPPRLDQGMMGESLVAILKAMELLRLEFKPGPVAGALVRAYDLRTLQPPQMTAAERDAFDRMISRAVAQTWEAYGESGVGEEAVGGIGTGDAKAPQKRRQA